MKYTVQIIGVGGQGVLLASMVLGNAAMEMGYKVVMSEVHGMAQRGGSVLSTLRFGDDVISPLEAAGAADLIMGFEPAETCRNLPLGNKDSVILMNLDPVLSSMVAAGFEEYPDIGELKDAVLKQNRNLYTIDATKIAIDAGKAVAANAVMIGAVAAMKGFPIPKEILLKNLLDQVSEKFRDLNVRAFEMGYSAMRRSAVLCDRTGIAERPVLYPSFSEPAGAGAAPEAPIRAERVWKDPSYSYRPFDSGTIIPSANPERS